jgi:outer membrane protein OmpA-like peptidoglycan-associated protein/5-hydroxyisourate hydrolase-like protein (transthyretin family)
MHRPLSHRSLVLGALILAASVLLGGGTAEAKKPKGATLTVVLTSLEGVPHQGMAVRFERLDGKKGWKGSTDAEGSYGTELPLGIQVEVVVEMDGWELRSPPKDIPADALGKRWTMRLPIEVEKVGMEVAVLDPAGNPEPDVGVTLNRINGGETVRGRTDFRGTARIVLPDGGEWAMSLEKHGQSLDYGSDRYLSGKAVRLRPELDYHRLVEGSVGGDAHSDRAAVVVELRDRLGNPEAGAEVRLSVLGAADVVAGRTDSAGRVPFGLPPFSEAQVTVQRQGLERDVGTLSVRQENFQRVEYSVDLPVSFASSRLLDVSFAEGASTMMDRSATALKDLAQQLGESDRRVEIVVHTASQGDRAASLTLSRERASVVRQYLVDQGIAPERVWARGLGDTEPVASSASEIGRQRNRRVEIRVLTGTP